jgi:hypothetical protein
LVLIFILHFIHGMAAYFLILLKSKIGSYMMSATIFCNLPFVQCNFSVMNSLSRWPELELLFHDCILKQRTIPCIC